MQAFAVLFILLGTLCRECMGTHAPTPAPSPAYSPTSNPTTIVGPPGAYAKAQIVLLVNVGINTFAIVCTLGLMWYMWRNSKLKLNLYIKCVLLMTIYQALYEIALPDYNISAAAISDIYVFGTVLGGLGAAVWSLFILIASIATITMGRIPTPREECVVFVCVHLGIFGYTAFCYLSNDKDYYAVIRLVLVVLDVLAIGVLFHVFRKRVAWKDRHENALYHMIRRLIFYPIIQCITRLGATCYNIALDASEIPNATANTNAKALFVLYIGVILMPAAGCATFWVFLQMQNHAPEQFCNMLLCRCAAEENDADSINRLTVSKRRQQLSVVNGNSIITASDRSRDVSAIDYDDRVATSSSMFHRSTESSVENYPSRYIAGSSRGLSTMEENVSDIIPASGYVTSLSIGSRGYSQGGVSTASIGGGVGSNIGRGGVGASTAWEVLSQLDEEALAAEYVRSTTNSLASSSVSASLSASASSVVGSSSNRSGRTTSQASAEDEL